MKPRLALALGMVVAAAAMRLVPHPPNVTPVAALALFGGAHFVDKRLAFLAPLAALFLSDAVLGFHSLLPLVYLCFAATVFVGTRLAGRSLPAAAGGALASSVLFYVVTNLGVWATSGMYERSFAGLVSCYVAAVPFFGYTVAGDLFYTLVLFGAFQLLERRVPRFARPSLS